MDDLKLRSNQLLPRKFLQKTDVMNIRVITIPQNYKMHYYPKQNVLALISFMKVKFHKIMGNQLENIKDSSIILDLAGQFSYKQKQAFFFENSILVFSLQRVHFRIFNIDNLSEPKFFKCYLPQEIDIYIQIHRIKIFRQEQINNLFNEKFKEIQLKLPKWWIEFAKQKGFMIQAIAEYRLYFYTAKMKKQIRKFHGFPETQPNFDTNFLIIPYYELFDTTLKQTYLKIYDISSMKVKGVIRTREYSELSYHNSLFIKSLNVLAIMYGEKLVLFEISSLKYIGSEQIRHNGYLEIMSYDDENGLTIFIRKNNVEIYGYEN